MPQPRTPQHPQNPDRPRPARPDWSGTEHRHAPECRRGTSCRTGHRSDNQLHSSLSRVMPFAVFEHSSELIACPISWSLTTSCISLELRPLPSTGITRLPQYYEPLRHPRAPEPSLTGVRLVFPDHAKGLPVLRALPLCTCCRQYPGTATGIVSAQSPNRISLPQYGGWVGLCDDLFVRPALRRPALRVCSAFTHVTACTLALPPIRDTLHRRLQPLRCLHSCSGCFRLEQLPGVTFTHWESAALPWRTPFSVIR
jgi:hypothetical protein